MASDPRRPYYKGSGRPSYAGGKGTSSGSKSNTSTASGSNGMGSSTPPPSSSSAASGQPPVNGGNVGGSGGGNNFTDPEIARLLRDIVVTNIEIRDTLESAEQYKKSVAKAGTGASGSEGGGIAAGISTPESLKQMLITGIGAANPVAGIAVRYGMEFLEDADSFIRKRMGQKTAKQQQDEVAQAAASASSVQDITNAVRTKTAIALTIFGTPERTLQDIYREITKFRTFAEQKKQEAAQAYAMQQQARVGKITAGRGTSIVKAGSFSPALPESNEADPNDIGGFVDAEFVDDDGGLTVAERQKDAQQASGVAIGVDKQVKLLTSLNDAKAAKEEKEDSLLLPIIGGLITAAGAVAYAIYKLTGDSGTGGGGGQGGVGGSSTNPLDIRGTGVSGLQQSFSDKLQEFQRYAQSQGHGFEINEGFRTTATQQEYWNKYKREHPSATDDEIAMMVARPGTSFHQSGLAADLRTNDPKNWKWLHENASRYGLEFPLSWEDWHIQPIGARQTREQLRQQQQTQAPQRAQTPPQTQAPPTQFQTPPQAQQGGRGGLQDVMSILQGMEQRGEGAVQTVPPAADNENVQMNTGNVGKVPYLEAKINSPFSARTSPNGRIATFVVMGFTYNVALTVGDTVDVVSRKGNWLRIIPRTGRAQTLYLVYYPDGELWVPTSIVSLQGGTLEQIKEYTLGETMPSLFAGTFEGIKIESPRDIERVLEERGGFNIHDPISDPRWGSTINYEGGQTTHQRSVNSAIDFFTESTEASYRDMFFNQNQSSPVIPEDPELRRIYNKLLEYAKRGLVYQMMWGYGEWEVNAGVIKPHQTYRRGEPSTSDNSRHLNHIHLELAPRTLRGLNVSAVTAPMSFSIASMADFQKTGIGSSNSTVINAPQINIQTSSGGELPTKEVPVRTENPRLAGAITNWAA